MPLRDAGLLGERRVDWRHETESRRPSARMQSPTRVYEWVASRSSAQWYRVWHLLYHHLRSRSPWATV